MKKQTPPVLTNGKRLSPEETIARSLLTRIANASKITQRLHKRPPTLEEIRLFGNPHQTLRPPIKSLKSHISIAVSLGYVIPKTGDLPDSQQETYLIAPNYQISSGELHPRIGENITPSSRRAFGKQATHTRLALGTADPRNHGTTDPGNYGFRSSYY